MAKDSKELISLELSKELHEALKQEAKEQEISFSALVRTVLKNYLSSRKRTKR